MERESLRKHKQLSEVPLAHPEQTVFKLAGFKTTPRPPRRLFVNTRKKCTFMWAGPELSRHLKSIIWAQTTQPVTVCSRMLFYCNAFHLVTRNRVIFRCAGSSKRSPNVWIQVSHSTKLKFETSGWFTVNVIRKPLTRTVSVKHCSSETDS